MPTAADVRVGVTGAVSLAPAGTTLPTTADGALHGAFTEVGYLDESGIVQSIAIDITDIKAWQNADVIRRVRTSHLLTYSFTLMETNENALEVYYGDGSVTGTIADPAGAAVEVKGDMNTRGSWVIHVIDGDELVRIVVPDGEVSERGDTSIVNGSALTYPLTITAYPDGDDVKAYIYVENNAGS